MHRRDCGKSSLWVMYWNYVIHTSSIYVLTLTLEKGLSKCSRMDGHRSCPEVEMTWNLIRGKILLTAIINLSILIFDFVFVGGILMCVTSLQIDCSLSAISLGENDE